MLSFLPHIESDLLVTYNNWLISLSLCFVKCLCGAAVRVPDSESFNPQARVQSQQPAHSCSLFVGAGWWMGASGHLAKVNLRWPNVTLTLFLVSGLTPTTGCDGQGGDEHRRLSLCVLPAVPAWALFSSWFTDRLTDQCVSEQGGRIKVKCLFMSLTKVNVTVLKVR